MNRTIFKALMRGALPLVAIAALTSDAAAERPAPAANKFDRVAKERSRQLAGRSRVIVQFNGLPDARVITGNGGVLGRQLGMIRAQVADLDNRALNNVASHPAVSWVGIDHPVFPTLNRTGPAVAATVARETLGLTGKGIGVAVIDSGITSWHDDLYLAGAQDAPRAAPRVTHFKDFTVRHDSRVWTSDQPSDAFGHGTHVAGVIAGNGFASRGARTGIAPEANLVGLKVLDEHGQGYISDVIAALDYAVAIKNIYNIRVINLSVASGVFESYKTDPLTRAARRAVEAGIVVVAAAGNLGTNEEGELQYGGITCPGNAPWVLTIGAASHGGTRPRGNDSLAPFSSRGPTWIDFAAKPDLVAHGVGTESLSDPNSTLYSAYAAYLLDGTRETAYHPYLSLTGTSMAAPVVAGTVALMLEANPALTPNAVKAILQYTAEVRDDEPFLAQGAGLLNTLGAIRMATFFNDPKQGTPIPGDVIEDEAVAWSEHITWGNTRVGGGVLLPGSNAWALDTTWGTAATKRGQPIVWGVKADDNIVWSTRRRDDNIVWSTRDRDDNIVWSTRDRDDNIVWSTRDRDDNIVWSTRDRDDNIVWSTRDRDDNIVWSTRDRDDNIVWSTRDRDDNIVWSTRDLDNIVWSTGRAENIVWSTACGGADCRGVIWSTRDGDDNIVWSTRDRDDNIVWSTGDRDDNIVWSTGDVDQVLWPASQPVEQRRRMTARH
jgi:serine protease AprX